MSADPQQKPGRHSEPTYPDQDMYLLTRIAEDIAPYLAERPQDRINAMQMAWRMVKSYAPASEAEVLNAGRIVSMSLVQLDLLRETTKRDLTPALKLQYVRAAVALNREISQTERLLERRQRGQERQPARQFSPAPDRVSRASDNGAVAQMIAEQEMEAFRMGQELERTREKTEAMVAAAGDPPVPDLDPGADDLADANSYDDATDIAGSVLHRLAVMERTNPSPFGRTATPRPDLTAINVDEPTAADAAAAAPPWR